MKRILSEHILVLAVVIGSIHICLPNAQATSLGVSPTRVEPGGFVTATWANISSPSTTDWIGLYSSPAAADNSYLTWQYTNGQASGNMAFTIPIGSPVGNTYELRLFSNTHIRLAISNGLSVQYRDPNLYKYSVRHEKGAPPFFPTTKVENELVNLANGNIHFTIPLLSRPGRNGLGVNLALSVIRRDVCP
jgi:hypothetical protein